MAAGVVACILAAGIVTCSNASPVQDWREHRFGDVLTFRAPYALTDTGERGIDTDVARWTGAGVTITIDYGPFSDPLDRYGDEPDYERRTESVDGRPARIVSFARAEAGWFAAVHFPELEARDGRKTRLTMVVEAPREAGREILLQIIRSIRFTGSEAGSTAPT